MDTAAFRAVNLMRCIEKTHVGRHLPTDPSVQPATEPTTEPDTDPSAQPTVSVKQWDERTSAEEHQWRLGFGYNPAAMEQIHRSQLSGQSRHHPTHVCPPGCATVARGHTSTCMHQAKA